MPGWMHPCSLQAARKQLYLIADNHFFAKALQLWKAQWHNYTRSCIEPAKFEPCHLVQVASKTACCTVLRKAVLQTLAQTAEEKKLIIAVGYMLRSSPAVTKAKQLMQEVRSKSHCCAVLCCAVLCCAVLCCAVLCCAVLCCAVLCCAVTLRHQSGLACTLKYFV